MQIYNVVHYIQVLIICYITTIAINIDLSETILKQKVTVSIKTRVNEIHIKYKEIHFIYFFQL